MNPNIDKFQIPSTGPIGANMQGVEFGVPSANGAAEQLPTREAASFAPPQPAITPAPPVDTTIQQQVSQIAPAHSTMPNTSLPVAMGTAEELERKWIAAAKTIVERTRDNPYLQSQELSKAGQEYRRQTGRSLSPDKE